MTTFFWTPVVVPKSKNTSKRLVSRRQERILTDFFLHCSWTRTVEFATVFFFGVWLLRSARQVPVQNCHGNSEKPKHDDTSMQAYGAQNCDETKKACQQKRT